jgi:kynurenine formamidase
VFGDDDELGTLNHLTPARVMAALATVREGRTIGLNLPLDAFDPPLVAHRGVPAHTIFGTNEFHRDDRLDGLFPQASTQIDGLRHFAHPDWGFYNGTPADQVAAGTDTLGIQHVAARGVVGRGVLVDVAAYRDSIGRPIDQAAGEPIGITDIEAALIHQGTTVLPGDVLLLRFGWIDWYRRTSRAPGAGLRSAGLLASEETAAWLWDHRVAVAAADNVALEAWPASASTLTTRAEDEGALERSSHSGMLHRILIPLLGLTIGELWDLDALAEACHERGSFEMLITAEPLHVRGGVGSPANALAVI